MKTSEVLKLGKRRLATDGRRTIGEGPICFALMAAEAHNEIRSTDYDRVRGIIHDRLGDCITLGVWLLRHHGLQEQRAGGTTRYYDKLQATRHAWVDSMIKEFAAKGD